MTLFLFPSPLSNFPQALPFYVFFLFPTIFPSSFKLPSQYASPTLSLSFLLPYLPLTPCRDPPQKVLTNSGSSANNPSAFLPLGTCVGGDVRVVGSYHRRGKHFVSSLVPTVPSSPDTSTPSSTETNRNYSPQPRVRNKKPP